MIVLLNTFQYCLNPLLFHFCFCYILKSRICQCNFVLEILEYMSTHHQPLHQQETFLGVIISNKQATTKGHHLFLLPMYCLIPTHCKTIFQVPSLLAVPSVPEFTQRVSLTQNYIHSCTHLNICTVFVSMQEEIFGIFLLPLERLVPVFILDPSCWMMLKWYVRRMDYVSYIFALT